MGISKSISFGQYTGFSTNHSSLKWDPMHSRYIVVPSKTDLSARKRVSNKVPDLVFRFLLRPLKGQVHKICVRPSSRIVSPSPTLPSLITTSNDCSVLLVTDEHSKRLTRWHYSKSTCINLLHLKPKVIIKGTWRWISKLTISATYVSSQTILPKNKICRNVDDQAGNVRNR